MVLKNPGVGKAIDLRRRAQVDHLDVPAEAGEPGLDARGGVLADVGDLGVPGGLVLALEDDLAVLDVMPVVAGHTAAGVENDRSGPRVGSCSVAARTG